MLLNDGREIVADVTGVSECPDSDEVQTQIRALLVSERKPESADSAGR